MRDDAPTNESIAEGWTRGWELWLKKVTRGLSGWNRSITATEVIDFGSVSANSQSAASTVTITGAREGDIVIVTALVDTVGIVYKGIISANDTAALFACNFTAGAINPASTTFRIIVLQN